MTGRLECDLVMRGGITSGIVYPRAIAKLAETYDFRCIGGTSAGAIAAAGSAAAAYGAKHGKDPFQTEIGGLPRKLGTEIKGKTVLERLFQPQPETQRLFRVLMSGLGRENKLFKIGRIVVALCFNYWPFVLAGAAIALIPLLAFALTSTIGGAWFWCLFVLGLVPAAVFVVAAASAGAVPDVIWRLPANFYGMCSGSSDGKPDDAGVLPLTDWLHDFFQRLAHRPSNKPLTFGDLWGTEDELAPRDVELVLMTTDVTRGVSHRFPFLEGSWGQLFFKEEDFERLFPKDVVTWMVDHAPKQPRSEGVQMPAGCHPLPEPADLPILLGARMSLSFPFLLSAVPLYAGDITNKNKEDGSIPLRCCWFSDGGLTSNFPIHFFDAPLPSRPTFGINLVPANVSLGDEPEDNTDEVTGLKAGGEPIETTADRWKNIYMPSRNSSGISSAARFAEFDGILGFFSALFDAARNWADTELMALPGYRDRIVHVALAENEGGLNLNMGRELIKKIGDRGERAGELLAGRFAPTPTGKDRLKDPQSGKEVDLTWDNHRWIRFRAVMAALQLAVQRLSARWAASDGETRWRSYAMLLKRSDGDLPKSYRFANKSQAAFAKTEMERIVAATLGAKPNETFDQATPSGGGRSPRPKPVLRMMPAGGNDPRDEVAGSSETPSTV